MKDDLDEFERLIRACQEESKQPRRDGAGACFELFLRALDGDTRAWVAIQAQYRGLVLKWVDPKHPEADSLVHETWVRFWRALAKYERPLTHHFANEGQLLKFLKRCADSARIDANRRLARETGLRSLDTLTGGELNPIERTLEREVAARQLASCTEQSLHLEQERLYFFLAFEVGLSPKRMVGRYPNDFSGVQQIYAIRERIVKRIRRCLGPEWQGFDG